MRYKELGHSGIQVSEIAFGGVEIGMAYGLSMKEAHSLMNEEDAVILLHNALDQGINFYDTARLYGRSEEIMGKAFEGLRDKVVLASKCRHFRLPDGTLPPAKVLKKVVRDSIAESLKALRTDYIDVFMLHYADLEILEIAELHEVFEELMQAGMIRVPGISVYEPEETELALTQGFWKVIQLPFNLMDQRQSAYFEKAHEEGVGLVARSVLMRGLLTDRSFQLHPALKEVQDHIHLFKALFTNERDNLPALAMQFASSHQAVSSVLVGIDKQVYLDEALGYFKGQYLSLSELDRAKELSYPNQAFLNLAQWDKNGWL